MSNLTYVIFEVSELDKIDFDQILEKEPSTLRYNVQGNLTFVKWNGAMPSSVASLTTKGPELSHEQMLEILRAPDWNPPMPGL